MHEPPSTVRSHRVARLGLRILRGQETLRRDLPPAGQPDAEPAEPGTAGSIRRGLNRIAVAALRAMIEQGGKLMERNADDFVAAVRQSPMGPDTTTAQRDASVANAVRKVHRDSPTVLAGVAAVLARRVVEFEAARPAAERLDAAVTSLEGRLRDLDPKVVSEVRNALRQRREWAISINTAKGWGVVGRCEAALAALDPGMPPGPTVTQPAPDGGRGATS